MGSCLVTAANTVKDVQAMLEKEEEIDKVQFMSAGGRGSELVGVDAADSIADLATRGFTAQVSGTIAGPSKEPLNLRVEPERLGLVAWTSRGVDGLLTLPEVLRKGSYVRLRKSLQARTERQITVDEFVAMCERQGIEHAESLRLLQDLHRSGVVLHFRRHPDQLVRSTVFLQPGEVLDDIF